MRSSSSDLANSRVRASTLEQAHVLDRDRCLVGERGDELDLLIGERPHLVTRHMRDTPIGVPSRNSRRR